MGYLRVKKRRLINIFFLFSNDFFPFFLCELDSWIHKMHRIRTFGLVKEYGLQFAIGLSDFDASINQACKILIFR